MALCSCGPSSTSFGTYYRMQNPSPPPPQLGDKMKIHHLSTWLIWLQLRASMIPANPFSKVNRFYVRNQALIVLCPKLYFWIKVQTLESARSKRTIEMHGGVKVMSGMLLYIAGFESPGSTREKTELWSRMYCSLICLFLRNQGAAMP